MRWQFWVVGGGWHIVAMVEVAWVPGSDTSLCLVVFGPDSTPSESRIPFWHSGLRFAARLSVSESQLFRAVPGPIPPLTRHSQSGATPHAWYSNRSPDGNGREAGVETVSPWRLRRPR